MSIGAGTATIGELRTLLESALEPVAAGDPGVIAYIPDAAAPPVLMIRWADPWLEADGSCRYTARLEVWAITPRTEPEESISDLEQMTSLVIRRIAADPYPWWIVQVDQPGAVNLGGVDYFGCRVQVRAPTEPDPEGA